jgi:tetratricopeptide (TPR) repeat protein
MKQQTKWMALILAMALFLPACTFLNKLKARDELNKGVKAFANQDYKTAITHFTKSAELDPSFTFPLTYKATAYSAMFVPGSQTPENVGNATEAIKTFEVVLSKEPNNINAIVNVAAIYYQLGDYDKSRDWCRKILAKENRNAEAMYRIGVINYEIANKATGMLGENVEGMLSSDKDKILKVVAEGIKVLDDAIKIKPDYFDAMHYLNLLYREEAKFATDNNEKNKILLKADGMALKAMELEKRFKELQKTQRIIKTDQEKK